MNRPTLFAGGAFLIGFVVVLALLKFIVHLGAVIDIGGAIVVGVIVGAIVFAMMRNRAKPA